MKTMTKNEMTVVVGGAMAGYGGEIIFGDVDASVDFWGSCGDTLCGSGTADSWSGSPSVNTVTYSKSSR